MDMERSGLSTQAEIEHMVRVIQITKWCNTSSLVVYIYEILITFGEEVNLIWEGVFSPGKALFLLLRYLTLGSLLFIITIYNLPEVSSEVRVSWVRFQWLAGSLIGLMAHLTLELRLYAMYNKSKVVLVVLVIGTLAVVFPMFGILVAILNIEGAVFLNLGEAAEQHMCVKVDVPDLIKIFWIPVLVGEAILVGLAIFKGIQTRGTVTTLNDWWSDRAPYGFLRFLVRDSVLFFLMVFATFLATELVWVFGGVEYVEVPVGFAIASSSIWSQRLLLNIRRHRQSPSEELHVTTDSSIPEFTNPARDMVLETMRSLRADSLHDSGEPSSPIRWKHRSVDVESGREAKTS